MVQTWITGSIIACVAGIIGLFVVLRAAAFAAHALPMGAFPGAAAAALVGLPKALGLAAFAGLAVLGIGRLGRRERHDVATALTLVALLGLGALCLSLRGDYAGQVYALLFGEVLGIPEAQILPVAAMGLAVIAGTVLLHRPLLLQAVSPDLAQVRGVPRRLETWFLLLLGLATVLTLPVTGALLAFSLMVGPPAAAASFTDRPVRALLLSPAIALLQVWAAIALAYASNWPVGFFVGTLGALAYGLGRAWTAWRHRTPPVAPRRPLALP